MLQKPSVEELLLMSTVKLDIITITSLVFYGCGYRSDVDWLPRLTYLVLRRQEYSHGCKHPWRLFCVTMGRKVVTFLIQQHFVQLSFDVGIICYTQVSLDSAGQLLDIVMPACSSPGVSNTQHCMPRTSGRGVSAHLVTPGSCIWALQLPGVTQFTWIVEAELCRGKLPCSAYVTVPNCVLSTAIWSGTAQLQ